MPDARKLRGATMVGTGRYTPERVLTNADLERIVDTTDEWIVTRSGIKERRIVAEGQAVTDMALVAAQAALEMGRVAAQNVLDALEGRRPAFLVNPEVWKG